MTTKATTAPLDVASAVKKRPFTIGSPRITKKYLKMLIYGPYGVGKTTLAASAEDVPEMSDVLYIDAEGGMLSLADRPDIDVIEINDFSQFARIHQYLIRHCAARDANDTEALKKLEESLGLDRKVPKRYNTVVIDSLSEVQRYNMYQLLGVKIGTAKIDDDWETPEFSHWNKTTEMMRLVVRSFRDLPMNIIFLSSEKVADEKKGTITINFPNQLSKDIPGFIDVVGYYQAITNKGQDGMVSVKRRLELEPGRIYLAKHRFGKALKGQSGIDEPTMQLLYNLRQTADN